MMTRINFELHTSDGWQLPEAFVKCVGYNFLCAKRHFEHAFAKEPEIFQNGKWIAIPNENVRGKGWHFAIGCVELIPVIGHIVALVESFFGNKVSLPTTSTMTSPKEDESNSISIDPTTNSTSFQPTISFQISENNSTESTVSGLPNSLPISFSQFLDDKTKNSPKYKEQWDGCEASALDFMEQQEKFVVKLCEDYYGFVVTVDHISEDKKSFNRELLEDWFFAALHKSDDGIFQIKMLRGINYKNLHQKTNDNRDSYQLYSSFNSGKFADLTPQIEKMFRDTEEQDKLPLEEYQRSIYWLMFRLLNGQSVKIADYIKPKFINDTPLTKPDGYWKIRLLDS